MEQLRLLYYQVLHHTNFVVGAGGDARVYVGALSEILTLVAGIVSLLVVVTLRKDLAGAVGTDPASLILTGRWRW